MTVSNVITYKNKLYTKKNKFSKNLENTEKNCVKGSGVRFPACSVYASDSISSISSRDAAGATPVCGDVSARRPRGSTGAVLYRPFGVF